MQIVIDIDEDVFTRLFDNGTEDYAIVNDDLFSIAKSIRNCTPLPEHHGRLVDADVLKEKLQEHHDFFVNAYGSFADMTFKEKARVDEIINCIAEVVNAPTIIEGSDCK